MRKKASRYLPFAGLLLGALLSGADTCSPASLDMVVSVVDSQGTPIDSFSIELDERGRRTYTTTADVNGQSTFVYHVKDLEATLLVFVFNPDYHPGVAIVDPLEQEATPGTTLDVTVSLVPADGCLTPPLTCSGHGGLFSNPSRSDGHLIVGVNDWVSAAEFPLVLAPYCLDVAVSESVDAFAMWTDFVGGDLEETLTFLEGSELVEWVDVRGYEGEHQGTTILIQFALGSTINEAQDLIRAAPDLSWLETVLSPTWGTVGVLPASTDAWTCALEEDPNIEYAHPDTAVSYGRSPAIVGSISSLR